MNKKNECMNVIKGLITFLVVIGHYPMRGVMWTVFDGGARFAVPFFFLVSGYFCYFADSEAACLKIPVKIKRTFWSMIGANLIYTIWKIIETTIYHDGVFAVSDWLWIFSPRSIFKFIVFNESPVGVHLWFVGALLYSYVMLYFLYKKSKVQASYMLIIPLLFIGIVVQEILPVFQIVVPPYVVRNFLFYGFPFVLMGSYLRKKYEGTKPAISNTGLVILIILCTITGIIERILTTQSEIFISSIFAALFIFMFSLKNPDLGHKSILRTIGAKYLMAIYIFHLLVGDVFDIFEWNGRIKITDLYIYTKWILIWVITALGAVVYFYVKEIRHKKVGRDGF